MKTHILSRLALVVSTVLALGVTNPPAPPARAAGPWYVAPGGSDSNSCLSPAAPCATINGAIGKASSGDTIYVAVGTYTGTGDEVVLIDRDIALSGGWDTAFGSQSGMSTIDGQVARRGVTVNSGVTASLGRLTVQNGYSVDYGGGINNGGGILTITDSTLTNNTANYGGSGIWTYGALDMNNSTLSNSSGDPVGYYTSSIFNQGTLTLNDTSISGNAIRGILSQATLILNNSTISDNSGGGIDNQYGIVTLNNSTVNGNTGAAFGGGISNSPNGTGGTLTLNNSTISNNAGSQAGGIYNGWPGIVTLNSSTISNNAATSTGGIVNGGYSEDVNAQNSVIAGNTGGSCPDVWSINSLGYTLVGVATGCYFTAAIGDLIEIDPQLGPLEGSPGYHPLPFTSPAINAGNPAGCTDDLGNPLDTDERGLPRVGRCDIGAYEYQGTVTRVFLPIIARNYCPPDYFDDFSNPASGWSVGEDDFVRSEYLNGEYRVLSKVGGFFYLFRAPACDRENYVVEADMRWEGTPGSSYGLIFGLAADFSQYYLFDVNTDFELFRLLRRDPGGFVTVVPVTPSGAINGGTASNHLKATRNGASITLEVNGVVLGTWSDGAITGLTGMGLISSPYLNIPTSDARFDNFRVTDLPGGGAQAGILFRPEAHREELPVHSETWPVSDEAQPH